MTDVARDVQDRTNSLLNLGYTGAVDAYGYVKQDTETFDAEADGTTRGKLTDAVIALLDELKWGGLDRPRFFVQSRVKSTADRVRYRASVTELEASLHLVGVTDVRPGSLNGMRTVGDMTVSWGEVPKAAVTRLPAMADVKAFPEFWVSGPGRSVAELVDCGHGYHLTDSCPNCDADQEGGATPEQRRALMEVVSGPTPGERRREALKAAIELAQDDAQKDLDDVHRAFLADLAKLGSVRATRLWARKAMRFDVKVQVWDHGRDLGVGGGDWAAALDASERMAVRLLKESVHPTRNAVDKALAEIQGRTAAELLDTIESFRKAVDR